MSPSTTTAPYIVDRVHDQIHGGQPIYAKFLAGTLSISREQVKFLSYELLAMHKQSVKWMPKCLIANEKCHKVEASKLILEHSERSANDLINHLVTVDKMWQLHYNPETAEQFL